MPRHYYAIRYAYAGAISDGDALARFSSQQDRATFCERFPVWEPVTLASIRHRYDVTAFDDPDRHQPAEDASTPARVFPRK
jgi:hypothetical protein